MIDEIDRSLHDALSIVKRTLESSSVVPGGGAVEAALSVHLEHIAETLGSRQVGSAPPRRPCTHTSCRSNSRSSSSRRRFW